MAESGPERGWGQWVKARARFLGLKLGDLAENHLGITPRSLSKWLGRNEMPAISRDKRRRLAEALDVDPYELPRVHKTTAPDVPGFITAGDPESFREAPKTLDDERRHEAKRTLREMHSAINIGTIAMRLQGRQLQRLEDEAFRIAEEAGISAMEIHYGALEQFKDILEAAKSEEVDTPRPEE